ncbi:MAG: nucleotide sugar dehydrogenase, partial [Bacteroidetes bacterium]|nr:nucleotide sugar dehydrogenase [Bacteroidota bacterium]
MHKELIEKKKKLAVLGLGYVGLPIALEFASKIDVIGFDINEERLEKMRNGIDPSGELSTEQFKNKSMRISSSLDKLKEAS